MARVIDTEELTPELLSNYGEQITYWLYNGLDCCVTREVFDEMPFPEYAQAAYDYVRRIQEPALAMMLRGFPVDPFRMQGLHDKIMSQRDRMREVFERFSADLTGQAFSVSSPKQLNELFYGRLGLPPVFETNKKTRLKTLTTNREALEKACAYIQARALAKVVLAYRELDKRKDILRSRVDSDNRLRTSYNVTGTETWRFSSSENAFGYGTNLQNIEPALRYIFTAPAGKKFAYIDGEQAESRLVGMLCWKLLGKGHYLDACESGDLHTSVARMVWPHLPWTGDLKRDRPIAEQKFYRHFTYRDMSKRGGHGTNYYGQPHTMAKHLKLATNIMVAFQEAYFKEFPEIREWHRHTAKELQTKGYIDNLFGFRRFFLGRRYDDSTLREAIAHVPQSTIAVATNEGMYRVYKAEERLRCELIHQNHDAIVVMYDEEREDEIIPELKSLMTARFEINGRECLIPADCEVGWNWAKFSDQDKNKSSDLESLGITSNPDGMKRYRGHDSRKRAEAAVSDRRFY